MGKGVPDANVKIIGAEVIAVYNTGPNGGCLFYAAIPKGEATVEITKQGYRPFYKVISIQDTTAFVHTYKIYPIIEEVDLTVTVTAPEPLNNLEIQLKNIGRNADANI